MRLPDHSKSWLNIAEQGLGYKTITDDSMVKRESELWQEVKLPELELKERGFKTWFLPLFSFATIATLLSLFVFAPDDSATDLYIGAKGDARVWIYQQRGSEVNEFRSGDSVQANDKVRAEIIVTSPSYAYWGILDANGELITGAQNFLESKLTLASWEKVAFPGSFEMVGQTSDEYLVVILCPQAGNATPDDVLKRVLAGVKPSHDGQEFVSGCTARTTKLR